MKKRIRRFMSLFSLIFLSACNKGSEPLIGSEHSDIMAESLTYSENILSAGFSFDLFGWGGNYYEKQDVLIFDKNENVQSTIGATIFIEQGYPEKGVVYLFVMDRGIFWDIEIDGERGKILEVPYVNMDRIVKNIIFYPENHDKEGVASLNLYLCLNQISDNYEDYHDNMTLATGFYKYEAENINEISNLTKVCDKYLELASVTDEAESYDAYISQISTNEYCYKNNEVFLIEKEEADKYLCSMKPGEYRVAFLLDNGLLEGVFDGKTYLDLKFDKDGQVAVCDIDNNVIPDDGNIHVLRILVTDLDTNYTYNYGVHEIK